MKEEVKEILDSLYESRRINSKYIVYVEYRGWSPPDKDDLRIRVIKNSSKLNLVQAYWYRTRQDRQNDTMKDGIYLNKQEFYNSVSNYYEVTFEEITLEELSLKNRSLPVDRLKDAGLIEEDFMTGMVEMFEDWADNKEDGRDYTVILQGEGIVTLEKLILKTMGWIRDR